MRWIKQQLVTATQPCHSGALAAIAMVVLGANGLLCAASAPAAPPQIPALHWEERSDWVNVKTDLAPGAIGDGTADDTAAIQKALEIGRAHV